MYGKYIKRLLDIIVSLLGMPLLLLTVIIFAPIIYFTDRGPVFYNALRLGRDGKIFKMIKFRSMAVDAPDIRNDDRSTFNSSEDFRVTGVGKFMRKTSIDEAPQLINVLIGNMSIVGPRPDLPEHLNLYDSNEYAKLSVYPGITGYNQAYYRNTIEWRERLKNDVYYAAHVSFLFDARIFIRTAFTVLGRKNVYTQNSEEMKTNVQRDLGV